MGMQTGTFIFHEEGGVLTGFIKAMGSTNPISNGRMNGNTFTFEGSIKTVFGKLDYKAQGTISGNTLQATAKTKFGMMNISGVQQ
ncbi:MAG: hypothetical protein BGN88_07505 [Clostridiales bacterium 43-6]|nr:MAG: hypothetical protein BGN88_07505 [Clostridiales bacterium 43-6]